VVSKLAALLRLADALDTEHGGKVSDITVEYERPRLMLKLHGQGDLLLEKWGLAKRTPIFEEVFGVKVAIAD
jgi:exopolyphosphatase/guanosine-5'-triphosphate,3'-diphosphate pyrophosphatase